MSNPASTTYLDGLGLSLPGTGAADYEKDYDQNYKVLDFIGAGKKNSVLSGIAVTAGAGLTVNWTAGTARIGSTDHAVGASSGSATDNTGYSNLKLANFVYVNDTGSVVIGTTLPTGEYAALAVVFTNAGAITKVVDARRITTDTHDHSSAAKGGSIYCPMFSAYRGGVDYGLSIGSWVYLPMDSETVDSANFYDNTTFKFQPTVAGYYKFTAGAYVTYASPNGTPMLELSFRKNGAGASGAYGVFHSNGYNELLGSIPSDLMYLNGSSDYIQAAAYLTGCNTPVLKSSLISFFSGHKVG